MTELRPAHAPHAHAPHQAHAHAAHGHAAQAPHAQEPARAINPEGQSEHKPALSFVEGPDAWWLTLEVPGLSKDALEITLVADHLTVRGEKTLPQAEGLVWHHNERAQGPFERVLKLPSDVDLDQIQAETKDGLLTVRLAKVQAARPRRVEIQ
ncbi:MAG: Hsp20/alpha crystallin family protein [Planctomycetota bacterium]